MTKDTALSRQAEIDRRCRCLVISVGNLREYIRQMLNTVIKSLVVVAVAAALAESFALSVARSVNFEIITMPRRWHHGSWEAGASIDGGRRSSQRMGLKFISAISRV